MTYALALLMLFGLLAWLLWPRSGTTGHGHNTGHDLKLDGGRLPGLIGVALYLLLILALPAWIIWAMLTR